MKKRLFLIFPGLLFISCLTISGSTESYQMTIEEKVVTVQDNLEKNGFYLETPVQPKDLTGRWKLVMKEDHLKLSSSLYRLVFLTEEEYSREMTRRWKSQGFKPAFDSLRFETELIFKENGTLVETVALLINGKPARQVTGAKEPWLWEYSQDNIHRFEYQFRISEGGIDLVYPEIIGAKFLRRMKSREEGGVTVYTQKLGWRRLGDAVYLHLGSFGLLKKVSD